MENYHTQNRHKYLIKLHLVFVIKYRKRLLKGSFSEDIKQWCYDICSKNEVTIDEMESDNDHLHMLVDVPPTLAPSKLRNKTEQIETALKLHHIEIKETP